MGQLVKANLYVGKALDETIWTFFWTVAGWEKKGCKQPFLRPINPFSLIVHNYLVVLELSVRFRECVNHFLPRFNWLFLAILGEVSLPFIMQFSELITTLQGLQQQLSQQAIRQVDQLMTLRNWLIGFYIVEYEQHGADRAIYGQNPIPRIALAMK